MEMEHDHGWRYLEPTPPIPLPPELAAFLATQETACVMQETSRGTAHVLKTSAEEIARFRGVLPIQVRHELYALPQAPVIRSLIRLYDDPEQPFAFETFANIADPSQAADFARLATQRDLFLLFYDEQLAHRLSKLVPQHDHAAIARITATATRLAARIPHERYDFDRAKRIVQQETAL